MKKFYTDGRTILARIAKESDSPELIDLVRKQFQLDDIVLPTLYECLDFDHYEIAERWWPNGKTAGIVVDPNRNFGKPIINDINVSTQLIVDLHESGHSIEDIIDWYDIDYKYIEIALNFEKRIPA